MRWTVVLVLRLSYLPIFTEQKKIFQINGENKGKDGNKDWAQHTNTTQSGEDT